MKRFAVVVALVVVSGLASVARAASSQEVSEAIKRAVEYVYSQQRDGNWEMGPRGAAEPWAVTGQQWGGRTAMATYALLAAGQDPQDPRIKQAITFLATSPIEGTYALGLRAQVWPFLPLNGDVRQASFRDQQLLAKSIRTQGDALGLYRYGPEGNDYDHSCSNYGVLGMWACAQINLEIPVAIWQAYDQAWRRHQRQDGGWCYINRPEGSVEADANVNREFHESTLSMTTAAVATLYITQDYLYAMRGLDCTGNTADPAIERGVEWISKNFGEFERRRQLYTLYNIERVGVASGLKYFGTIDWYKTGSEWLVRRQGGDGSWGGDKLPDTCWAILFLVRGRAPVMMNKLEYVVDTRGDKPRPPTWNQRPREVANVTRWVGRKIERDLNWQIVNLKVNVEDLHDAPLLWISGSEALNLTKEEEEQLKTFVEQGGIILGHADCSRINFTTSFKKLGSRLFPMYEFRELPDDHPIYTGQQYKRKSWMRRPAIEGLSNGCRELMVLFPRSDPGRSWQVQAFSGPEREPQAQAMANIFLYSVSMQNLRFKGETYIVKADGSSAQNKVKVARLEYPGNWNPEPGGWKRLAAFMHNTLGTDIDVQDVKLGTGKLTGDFKVAHLTGSTRLNLPAAAKAEIKKYVEGGGTLVMDAAAGNTDFALTAEQAISEIFADQKPRFMQLGADHALFSAGYKIEQVSYRPWARKLLGNIHTPRVRGWTLGNRVAVVLSAEDLSVGLVGNPVDGIMGYSPVAEAPATKDAKARFGASEIMANIILHAAGVSAVPRTGGGPRW